MSKFIGLKRIYTSAWSLGDEPVSTTETSVIINLDNIAYLEVETDRLHMSNGDVINLNSNSTKFLSEILMENEYKLQGEEE